MLLMYLYYATTRLAHYLYVQHKYAQIQPLSHTSCARSVVIIVIMWQPLVL